MLPHGLQSELERIAASRWPSHCSYLCLAGKDLETPFNCSVELSLKVNPWRFHLLPKARYIL